MARDEISRCAEKLRAIPGRVVVEPEQVTIDCTLRGKSRAGLAYPALKLVKLNPGYFKALGEGYRATIAHEYAHLVKHLEEVTGNWKRGPAHGLRWQRVMRALGYPPERTLTAEERNLAEGIVQYARKVRRFRYEGVNCGHAFTFGIVRHTRAERGARFLCATGACKYKPRDQRGLAFDKEIV
jgi:predicted SprT family Zn-dependent metalloprotease